MKLALICPHFPPDHCGVGDHTARMAAELLRQGHEVTVFTAQHVPVVPPGVQIHSLPAPWKTPALQRIETELRSRQVDVVVIQYTPFLYAYRLSIHPQLPRWLRGLRSRLGKPVTLYVHELHYPLGTSLSHIGVGIPQFLLFQALVLAADQMAFTHEVPYEKYSRLYPWKAERFFWLPVGANIPPSSGAERNEIRLRESLLGSALIPKHHRILLQFGSGHPARLFDHSFAALKACVERFGADSTTLVFVGVTSEELRSKLSPKLETNLGSRIKALGYLEPDEASRWLSIADAVLAPFIDGVSTRRSSVITALAHACPVVALRNWQTDPSIPWDRICHVSPTLEPRDFADCAARLISDREAARRLGEISRDYYESHFSWPSLASRLVENIQRRM